jgi:radical SAM/Cys-rich protein
LVYNPVGAVLPPVQSDLEQAYRLQLGERHGIEFHRLLCLANLPVTRFRTWLERSGQLESYLQLLFESFNPATVEGLMCRDTINVGFEGDLFDCDVNQMAGMPMAARPRRYLWEIEPDDLFGERIATAGHCFGCTAGHGSGCGGALA